MGGDQAAAVRVRAPGKINLGLTVGRRQPDGYHRLASVFQAVSLHEDVTVREADELTLTVSGLHADRVPLDRSNLAWRAAAALGAATGFAPTAAIHIDKGVPVAGGMGGGSADAAATLVALDHLWGTGLTREALAEIGSALGSDVPFALLGQTAVGRGRGDVLTSAMSRGRYHWALGIRHQGLSTPEVYAAFDDVVGGLHDEPEPDRDLLAALRSGDAEAVGAALVNDLQDAALELAPHLAETLAVAQDAGALGVLVSGSGPTVAALGRDAAHAQAMATAMTRAHVADEALVAVGPVGGARVVEPDGAPDRGARTLRSVRR